MSNEELIEATIDDAPILRQLLELYAYDFSEINSADIGDDGRFGYRHLDRYWTESNRHAYLIRVDGHIAGFVLVRMGEPHSISEFFVMRKYRRRGIGLRVARRIFDSFPGEWRVNQIADNESATAFWHEAIPVDFTEVTPRPFGPVQRFRIPRPQTPNA